ncbi:hypothetical protein V5799_000200 [Amblyomma americanum]|uniref:KY-like immunoglobulin-like domain-containing protein n=1 Tax=Amblyomma americanum TaxID=6943 RepID=A0AAQ4D3Q6_AMBAM
MVVARPLTDFMATLHKNAVEQKKLPKFVSHTIHDDLVTFFLAFPDGGQYGMDIYTRKMNGEIETGEKHLLTHSCKSLIIVFT